MMTADEMALHTLPQERKREMLKAGNQRKGAGMENEPQTNIPKDFQGLTIGRIVHVWIRLPTADQPRVERPAIVTEVKCHERGIIAAHVFMSPTDPPGEIIVHQNAGDEFDAQGQTLGAELCHYHRAGKEDWTWHWPERV